MRQEKIDFDYETRSGVNLPEVGVFNYAADPSTEIILMAYSINDSPIKTWEPHKAKLPEEVEDAFSNPFCEKIGYNVQFERLVTKYKLGYDIPLNEWKDVQVRARYYSLPGYLEDVGEILNIETQKIKQRAKDGSLIKLFCEPFVESTDSPLFGQTEAAYRDWNTNPKEWEEFVIYNQHDVRAEIEVDDIVSSFDLPKHEWEYWYLDQKINERGIPLDMRLIDGALKLIEFEQDRLTAELRELTGVDNPNSREQILAFVRQHGYPFTQLGKAFVQRALGGEGGIDDVARKTLELRAQLSKSSVEKFATLKQIASPDGYLRHQFSFLGAPRTGRYASRGINIQNLTRPDKEVNERLELAVELVRNADYDGIKREFRASVLDVISSCLRPVFRAPAGSRFIIADLNAIENRVLGWLANCSAILQVFEKGLCPYKSFAVELYRKPYEQITKEERNNSKPAVLGAGYRLSGGEEIITEAGDKIYTGLMGYGRSLGIEIDKDLADKSIAIFRKKFKEVKQFWYDLEDAFIRAVRDGEEVTVGFVTFRTKKNVLCVILPSGRSLHYVNPKVVENVAVQGRDGTYYKTGLYYDGLTDKRQWQSIETHGGKICENLCQSVARDVLMVGIKKAEERGFGINIHVHDEIAAATPCSSSLQVEDLENAMADPIKWAPGLPLKAEGFESEAYRKN